MAHDATFPPDLPKELTLDAAELSQQRRRDKVRQRMHATMPPLPELRFEMSYLRSVLPACRPLVGDNSVTAAQAISEGKEVQVVWKRAVWITVRDQIVSPLFQGMFWGLLSVCGGGVLASLKAGLGFGQGKVVAPGDVHDRDPGQWRNYAKSRTGALEANVVI